MPRGSSDIPILRHSTLTKTVSMFDAPPELILQNMFSERDYESSTIEWESHTGSRDMAAFKPPGAPTPMSAPGGIAQHSAEAAFWGDKRFYDEEFLNNLRKEGTRDTIQPKEQKLARDLQSMVNRTYRRKEWMFAKMLTEGSFSYEQEGGMNIEVDYDIPDSHIVSLGADYYWENGPKKDIWGDIIDGKDLISSDCGVIPRIMLLNSQTFKLMARDEQLQNLLSKSGFDVGNLFAGNKDKIIGANTQVVATLLDLDQIIIYNELYEAKAWLTAVVTGGSTTTISVSDPTDFVVGGTLRFHDVSAKTYEDETISAVNIQSGTVTVSTAPTASFKAGEDYVSMTRKYIPNNKVVLMVKQVDGVDIIEHMRAPYGLNRTWGLQSDTHDMWDPDGTYLRVQDKGLPVMYQRDAIYILTVNA